MTPDERALLVFYHQVLEVTLKAMGDGVAKGGDPFSVEEVSTATTRELRGMLKRFPGYSLWCRHKPCIRVFGHTGDHLILALDKAP